MLKHSPLQNRSKRADNGRFKYKVNTTMGWGRQQNGLLPLSVCFSMNEMACSWGKREKSEATCRVGIIKSKSAMRSALWHTSWAHFFSSHFFLSFLNTEGMATLVHPFLKIHHALLIYGLIKSNKLLATAQVGCVPSIFSWVLIVQNLFVAFWTRTAFTRLRLLFPVLLAKTLELVHHIKLIYKTMSW